MLSCPLRPPCPFRPFCPFCPGLVAQERKCAKSFFLPRAMTTSPACWTIVALRAVHIKDKEHQGKYCRPMEVRPHTSAFPMRRVSNNEIQMCSIQCASVNGGSSFAGGSTVRRCADAAVHSINVGVRRKPWPPASASASGLVSGLRSDGLGRSRKAPDALSRISSRQRKGARTRRRW